MVGLKLVLDNVRNTKLSLLLSKIGTKMQCHCFVDLVVIGLLYMAYHDGCRHKFTFLPRLRP